MNKKQTLKKQIELLSPAKNFQFGKTALDYGADAVYIGANKFGARKSAGNSLKDIEKLCLYAHKFNAKVYVTINTILFDNELQDVEKLIHQLWNAGADAIIIQDFAILEMNLPPIPIHSSTQMHNVSVDKIKFYEKIGLSRVILARELSLAEIIEIKNHTNIELENFIHGAICISYSGQCYMSAYLGYRSGNRGECAQACRLKYNLLNSKKQVIEFDKNILSVKDMNRTDSIEAMIDAGITSFKIEGRLKDLNYLKNVTAHYRKTIDNILENKTNYEKSSAGVFNFDFSPDPEITFNRTYSDYFLNGRTKISSFSPKSVGKQLGKVTEINKNYIVINTNEKIVNGDGLCFFDTEGELTGFNVSKTEGNKIFTNTANKMNFETIIYRNHNHQFSKMLSKNKSYRKIPVNISFNEIENGFELIAQTDDKTHYASSTLIIKKEIAQNKEKVLENIQKQLKKTGNSPFFIQRIENHLQEIYFIPIGALNELRRNVLYKLEHQLSSNYKRTEKKLNIVDKTDFFLTQADYKSNISNKLSKLFYEKHGAEILELAPEITGNFDKKEVMVTKFCLKYERGICPKYQNKKSEEDIKFLKYKNKIFRLEFDCKACVMKIIPEK